MCTRNIISDNLYCILSYSTTLSVDSELVQTTLDQGRLMEVEGPVTGGRVPLVVKTLYVSVNEGSHQKELGKGACRDDLLESDD